MCNWFLNPIDCGGEAIEDGATDIAAASVENTMKWLYEQSVSAAGSMIDLAFTWWIELDSPEVAECIDSTGAVVGDCSTATGAIGSLQSYTAWIVGAIAVGALAYAGARMAWSARGDETKSIVRGLVMLLFVTTVGIGVLQAAMQAGDGYSSWVINQALGDEQLGASVSVWLEVMQVTTDVTGNAAPEAIPIVLGLGVAVIAGLAGFLQFVWLLGVWACLVLVIALLPVAAALSMTEGGAATMRKYMGFLLSLLLYKPVAATVWAGAVLMMEGTTFQGNGDGLIEILIAVTMMILALVALPALMRLVAPVISTIGTGGGGAAALGAGAMLASGAADLRASGSGRSTSTAPTQTPAAPPQSPGSATQGAKPSSPSSPKPTNTGGGGKGAATTAATGSTVAGGALVLADGTKKAIGGAKSGAEGVTGGGPSGAKGSGK